MTPPAIAALRVSVPVHEDGPGTLTSILARSERAWRERPSCAFSPEELDSVDFSECSTCGERWTACVCEVAT